MLDIALTERVRDVVDAHGRLPVAIASVSDSADLYEAGMTSHASVEVMLALEEAFDVEFSDAMLKRSVFGSVNSICHAVAQLGPAQAA